jgi:AcrR family transcriptional regulator
VSREIEPGDDSVAGEPPRERAGWGTITRERVVEAAIRVVKSRGYEQMTIRSLAAELAVSPMSLYRHVRDKDDLLDEVVDRLLARSWRPRADKKDWRAWVAEAANKLRCFLVSQPAGLHVYLQHPVVSPAAISRMNAMMSVLREALGDEQAARDAYAAIHTFTVGFAALEASRTSWTAADDGTDDLARQLAAYTTAQQFDKGLAYLLEGIDPRTRTRRDTATAGSDESASA